MVEMEITRMSSKGQIVIPREMRKDFADGEKFVVIKAGKQLILKTVADFDENIDYIDYPEIDFFCTQNNNPHSLIQAHSLFRNLI